MLRILLFGLILLTVIAFNLPPAIVLENEPAPLQAGTFCISGVQDERAHGQPVALLIPDGGATTVVAEDLQGGAVAAVGRFFAHNVEGQNRLRPIIITIKQLQVVEKALPGKRVEGKITVALSFGIKRMDDTVHLIDYQGGMHYNRPSDNSQPVEPALRHSLMNALVYFNNWMDKQADTNAKLATAVKMSFSDYTNPADKDTIYYDANRPLTWDDFGTKRQSGRYTADVFPGFGFDEHLDIRKGVIYIDVAMKVYLPKSDCRVKDDGRTDQVLNHEQRHFDIVKIISERYKRHLQHTEWRPENYDGDLHAAYFEYMHQMNLMQDSYDAETRHGQDAAEQNRWDQKITAELQSYGIAARL